ncbi:MAG: Uncharacterised protein [Cyanobium sp. ARS6]|nr:MAG: Uncharacterised protein [Cyanobium sp. ARS6]
MFSVVEDVGAGLVDRYRPCIRSGIRNLSRVKLQGLKALIRHSDGREVTLF